MNKIKRLNDYKITSGGYLTDILDRAAQAYLIKKEPFYPYWLTASAKIKFLRQSDEKTPIRMSVTGKTCLWNSGKASVVACAFDSLSGKMIARAKFKFVGKTHLHKGENKCGKLK